MSKPDRTSRSVKLVKKRLPHGGRDAADATAKLWRRARSKLEQLIASGRFGVEGRLPSEMTLAAELGVTRHTLRLAMSDLIAQGLLRSEPYRGVFRAPQRIEFRVGPTTRLVDAVEQAGLTPGAQVLSSRLCAPPREVATRLGVAQRTQVVEIVMLLTANSRPLGVTTSWMPADRFGRVSEIIENTKSLRRALAQLGVSDYRRAEVRITSRIADRMERKSLDLARGAVLIGLDGVSTDRAGEPTHVFNYRFDADRIAFVLEPG